MTRTIPQESFSEVLFTILDETFDSHHGVYLDKDTSLFSTLDQISASEASLPVGDRCATIAAQVEHVIFYLQVLERSVAGQDVGRQDQDVEFRQGGGRGGVGRAIEIIGHSQDIAGPQFQLGPVRALQVDLAASQDIDLVVIGLAGGEQDTACREMARLQLRQELLDAVRLEPGKQRGMCQKLHGFFEIVEWHCAVVQHYCGCGVAV